MNVTVIATPSEWRARRQEWNRLLSSSATDHVFLTYEWLSTWWNTYGGDRKLRICVVEDASEIVGIAPLYAARSEFRGIPVAFRGLFLLGGPEVEVDFLNVLIRRGLEEPVLSSLLRYLVVRADWDILWLEDLGEDTPAAECLGRLAAGNGLGHFVRRRFACPSLSLPDTWEAFLEMPDALFKQIVRSKGVKKLERRHRVAMIAPASSAELDPFLDDLFRLHAERWRSVGEPGAFHSDSMRSFYRGVSREMFEAGWLRLRALEIDGTVEAIEYGLIYGGAYYSLQGACSLQGLTVKAGNVLQYKVFESLVGEARTVHLLRGAEPYKYQWGGRDVYTCRVGLSRGLPGGLLLGTESAKTRAVHCAKRLRSRFRPVAIR